MKKEVFNKLILEPSKVHPKYKDELKQLVETFPYSANIRLLYLSSLLNDCDVIFEQELKKTAAYISDRRILKKIIDRTNSEDYYLIDNSGNEKSEDNSTFSNLVVLKDEEKEKSLDSKDSVPEKTKDNYTDKEEVSNQSFPKEITKETAEQGKEEKKESENLDDSTKKNDDLNDLIVSSAINASLSIEIEEASKKEKLKEEEVQSKNQGEDNTTIKRTDEPKTFLEWIGGNEIEKVSPPFNAKEKERLEFKKRAESLIDEFIENQPKIKPKVAFYSPENMAQKSIEDSEGIVTETLANVYANQGNIEKAKSIYKQLILNNPEKKSYFASLLKKLREE
tara:strand:+ start:747 stop:1757 length:1011 start_codon:yes stop_codon:yes gene_type:complete